MGMDYVIDDTKLAERLYRFVAYVQYRNNKDFGIDDKTISFEDTNGYLGDAEDYKTEIAAKARKALQSAKWTRENSDGVIAQGVLAAIRADLNLVDSHQKSLIKNILNPLHDKYNPLAESALFEVYRGENQEEAFNGVLKNISRNYDLISYLFFVKSPNRFLPVRTTHFEKSFKAIGVEYELSGRCSWENYQGFLNIVQEVQRRISPMLKGILRENELRLIDAHSFLWVIQEGVFEAWEPDEETTKCIEQRTEAYQQLLIEGKGGMAERSIEQFNRSSKVSKATKLRARGICQLCGNPAPFIDKKGEPYLEIHHVQWLSRGGQDNTDNTVALCSNCHSRMHILDDADDIAKLNKALTD